MRYSENIKEIAEFEPDYMGFIFYDKSPRFVGEDLSVMVLEDLPENVKKVGVFVNDTKKNIIDKVLKYNLDFVQLHGDETPDFCKDIRMSKVGVIKAIRINLIEDIRITEKYIEAVDFFLFDTKGEKFGGNGMKFDWKLLENYNSEVPFFLSGGLGINDLDPYLKKKHESLHAFDINSGFEIEPGLKDEQVVEKAIGNLKKANEKSV